MALDNPVMSATGPSILDSALSFLGNTLSFLSILAVTLPIIHVITGFPSWCSNPERISASENFIGSDRFLTVCCTSMTFLCVQWGGKLCLGRQADLGN